MDILIPLGGGSLWEDFELRIALRSIEKYAEGFDRIFIVGKDPGFLSSKVIHLSGKKFTGNKESRIANKVLWTFENTVISDNAVFWNDDFVLCKKTDVTRIPFYHAGPLIDCAENHPCTMYKQTLFLTHHRLVAAGRPALNYDVHAPIIYNRQSFLALREWWKASEATVEGMTAKSIYANHLPVPAAEQIQDIKIRYFKRGQVEGVMRENWIFSYNDAAIGSGLKEFLEEQFPSKSIFESR